MSATAIDEVLAEAERLAEIGRFRHAIDMLSDVNRHQRSAQVERRLVGLRHRAFFAERHPGGRASWPPANPGQFDGCDGLPEIGASDLSVTALRSGLLGCGALVVRGLLPVGRAEALAVGIRKSIGAFDAVTGGRRPVDADDWYWPFEPVAQSPSVSAIERQWVRNGGGVLAVDSPRCFFDLTDSLESAGVIDLLGAHFGERPALSVKKTTLREVPPDTDGAWHQDGAFLGAGIRAVNVWIALSPCGVDAPSMDIVARRLDGIVPPGDDGAAYDWTVSDDAARRAAGDRPIVCPVFTAGDAILFDELNLHRTGASPGLTRPRYAIEAWCFAPSAYPLAQIPVSL